MTNSPSGVKAKAKVPPVAYCDTAAAVSACGTYRYALTRAWERDRPRACLFCMLNPSIADAALDDPTIRRCVGFARAWGFGAIHVVNLFALRSTEPKVLYAHADPVGPQNDTAIRGVAPLCEFVVAAWGAHGGYRGRGVEVARALAAGGHVVHCLGTTGEGHPRHPLYLKADTKPVPFTPPEQDRD